MAHRRATENNAAILPPHGRPLYLGYHTGSNDCLIEVGTGFATATWDAGRCRSRVIRVVARFSRVRFAPAATSLGTTAAKPQRADLLQPISVRAGKFGWTFFNKIKSRQPT